MLSNNIHALPNRWREDAAQLRTRYADPRAAQIFETAAADLEEALEADAGELLTLTQAADACGYSRNHLGRLVRSGDLRNYGRQNAPKLLRSELPVKPGALRNDAPTLNLLPADRQQNVWSIVNSIR